MLDQLNIPMTQLTVHHTRQPSAQCGSFSFNFGRCHAPHFTVCYILVLVVVPLVQSCLKFPHLQSTFVRPHPTVLPAKPTLSKYTRSAHLGLQLLGTSETTWNGWSNLFMSSFPWPFPLANVPDTEVVKSCQADYVVCKWCSVAGSLCTHCPWLLLRWMQPTGGSAQLVLAPSSSHYANKRVVGTSHATWFWKNVYGSRVTSYYADTLLFDLRWCILFISIFIMLTNVDTIITLYFYVCRWKLKKTKIVNAINKTFFPNHLSHGSSSSSDNSSSEEWWSIYFDISASHCIFWNICLWKSDFLFNVMGILSQSKDKGLSITVPFCMTKSLLFIYNKVCFHLFYCIVQCRYQMLHH